MVRRRSSMSKCHVVYVINSIRKSGPNEVLLNMVRAINQDYFQVTVVSFLGNFSAEQERLLTEAGAQCINIGLHRKRDITLKGAKLLRNLFGEIQPDIIHSHGILSDIEVARSKYCAPFFTTVHNDIRADYIYLFGNLLGRLYAQWHLFYLRKFSYVINCSETAYDANRNVLPESLYVRNGVDNTLINGSTVKKVRTELGFNDKDTLYMFAGSLSQRKNVVELVSQFNHSRCANEYLIIMGEGELYDDCMRIAGDSVRLLGFREDAQEVLAAGDVYVSFSRSEGFSISVIEALEKGLYLLLSDIPSHKEVFQINPESYIGEYFTSDTFRSKKSQLKRNMSDRHRITRFKDKYLSAQAMMHEYEQYYRGVKS